MRDLQPSLVWRHFAALCAIPRPSKHEAAVREHILAWAGDKGLPAAVDTAGNLLLRKAASAGREQRPSVLLQGHLDMVCQVLSPEQGGQPHDFLRDAIRSELREGWVVAPNTTLGADNGIGVALALAALEDDSLTHGPLEVLLTVDEEAGMGGAAALQPGWLHSRLMLNLDAQSQAVGEFYVGCSGGCYLTVERGVRREALPAGYRVHAIRIAGLRGGHSGFDIHRGRGNANRLLVRALLEVGRTDGDWRLASMGGGTAGNAIPREASAIVGVRADRVDAVEDALARLQATLRAEMAGVDDDLSVSWQAATADHVIARADCDLLLETLAASPYGVRAMSPDFAGVVETSNNLGIVGLQGESFTANLLVRSMRDEGARQLVAEIEALWRAAGCHLRADLPFPCWTPNPASPLLALCSRVFRHEFGAEPSVRAIHIGLECGLIGARYPGLDSISFGPTIRDAHAPGERVEVESVAKTWRLLCRILAAL